MTINVDLYYTMRSPYCYLSTPQLVKLTEEFDLHFHLKPVYPLAVSDSTFFERVNPQWPPYLRVDTARIAKRLDIPFLWPRPDPIVQDRETHRVATEQPYIRGLTQFAQIAAEQALGLEYVAAVSGLLFNPAIDSWRNGTHLADALSSIGLDIEKLDQEINTDGARLETPIQQNRADQLASGHWGAPLFVFEGEVFFGQDRIEDLVWHLGQHGLNRR